MISGRQNHDFLTSEVCVQRYPAKTDDGVSVKHGRLGHDVLYWWCGTYNDESQLISKHIEGESR